MAATLSAEGIWRTLGPYGKSRKVAGENSYRAEAPGPPPMMTPITQPMVVFDERRAINRVAIQVASALHKMSAAASRESLSSMLRDCLRRGDLIVTVKAIEAAEKAGDELADSVLRFTYAEMKNAREPMSKQLEAFGERAVLRPPVTRGRGAAWYDDWTRNIGICVLIYLVSAEFDVRPTRNREGRRQRKPSGISLVAEGLKLNRIELKERTIQEHLWLGLPGVLVREAIRKRALDIPYHN